MNNTQLLLQVGLLLHIIGLATVTGVTISSYLLLKQFWTQYTQDKQKGFVIMHTASILPTVAGIGLLLIILSGVMMMAATAGVYGGQLWFRLKMILLVLIIGGSMFMKRGMEKRLRMWVLDDIMQGNRTKQIGDLVRRISYMRLLLLLFIIIIFILSVFRFQ